MRRLSDLQLGTLATLDDESLTPIGALLRVGYQYQRTLGSLVRLGLARYFPYGAAGEGCWRITPAGRRALRDASAETPKPR